MADVLDKNVLKALSSETRQEILKLLAKRPYTASELSKLLKKHVTTIAEHIEALEKSELIAKKESGNKWMYYALTQKGEKMFKPQFYSWTLLLVLSVISFTVGLGRFFTSGVSYSRAFETAKSLPLSAERMPAAAFDFSLIISIILISLGIIGAIISIRNRNLKTFIVQK